MQKICVPMADFRGVSPCRSPFPVRRLRAFCPATVRAAPSWDIWPAHTTRRSASQWSRAYFRSASVTSARMAGGCGSPRRERRSQARGEGRFGSELVVLSTRFLLPVASGWRPAPATRRLRRAARALRRPDRTMRRRTFGSPTAAFPNLSTSPRNEKYCTDDELIPASQQLCSEQICGTIKIVRMFAVRE